MLDTIDISALLKAQKALSAALIAPENDLNRDASIQRFKLTFELTWKTLQRTLKVKGKIANSPRDVFRDAAQIGLLNDPVQWFEFTAYRHQTLDAYNEEIAQKIFQALPLFQNQLATLIDQLKSL